MAISQTPPATPPQGEDQFEQRAPVQPQAWARAQAAWAGGAPLPWLHREVAQRMADRLSVIRSEPQVVLEWDALAGQSQCVLQTAYPQAQWVAVESGLQALHRIRNPAAPPAGVVAAVDGRPGVPEAGTPAAARGPLVRLTAWARQLFGASEGEGPGRSAPARQADARTVPTPPGFLEGQVPPAHGQLLWSNMGLHNTAHPGQRLRRWHAALAVDGFLMFSTLGPDTLRQLSSLWREAGWGPPAQAFRDMHDWGDDLVAAGFADPVMDQEEITLTWADADAALAELRTLGRNAHPARHAGCRTPRWRAQMKAALQERAGPDGRIALSFEVIYGHAFRPPARLRVEPVVAVELNEMRRMVQTARRPV